MSITKSDHVFNDTSSYNIIYIFGIPIESHDGLLKIGKTSITNYSGNQLYDDSPVLIKAARERIDAILKTSGLSYELFYTTLAVTNNNIAFSDNAVHDVLKRSGIKQPKEQLNGATEWFECDVETAKNAINAVKENRLFLKGVEITDKRTPIIFRKEQKDAINKAIKRFTTDKGEVRKTQRKMLWNAKMRFGKTLSALQVIKELDFRKTIIITHRPVVNDGWYEDFYKIFYDQSDKYFYGSKTKGATLEELLKYYEKGKHIIYFASIQDLRGSSYLGKKYDKNDDVFNFEWDFVIVDEAHEGTLTDLGRSVIKELRNSSKTTKILYLSGTPYNILSDDEIEFEPEEVYTWDYIMEQQAKLDWVEKRFGDYNPYESLPKLNIYTYDLGEALGRNKYDDFDDLAFNFKEFFRTWQGSEPNFYEDSRTNDDIGTFVHEKVIIKFLNLLSNDKNETYPFSTVKYRENFRHTLWLLPGVKEAKALSKLLNEHPVFESYDIVNVAGDGDDDAEKDDALEMVRKAIGDDPTKTYTITLSCGRLTTGVTVPAWTAVLMLYGSSSTSATSYMQTIFRVQTPAIFGPKEKTNCYVFDFAPDRTLKIVAEISTNSNQGDGSDEEYLKEFINFCPVIGLSGSQMKSFDEKELLSYFKQHIIDKVVRNGFEDSRLYNPKLFDLSDLEISEFKNLEKIISTSVPRLKNTIKINDEGLDQEEYEDLLKKEKKNKTTNKELSELEKERRRRLEQRRNCIKLLNSIAVRVPLMVFGSDLKIVKDISVNNFTEITDDLSWEEFMPKGITKKEFKKFTKYFDNTVFSAACKKIIEKTKVADKYEPIQRAQVITHLFNTFKNPDRETVLTPWRVVNMHMENTLGGASFYDNSYQNIIEIDDSNSIRWIEVDNITSKVFDKSSKVLELNSKTGLYPLYCSVSFYQNVIRKGHSRNIKGLWKEVVENNVYVICRTKMAKAITNRTLVGFNENIKTNILVIEDIVEQMKEQYSSNYNELVNFILNGRTWNKGVNEMKFNAVVGNPPYQNGRTQIYTDFYLLSQKLGEYVSLVFPVGWQEPKDANNLSKLNNKEVKEDKQIIFIDNRQNLFPGIAGVEWTNFILWQRGYDNGLEGFQLLYTNGKDEQEVRLLINKEDIEKPKEIIDLVEIVRKDKSFNSLISITSARKPYGLSADVISRPEYYGLPPMFNEHNDENDISVIGILDRQRVNYYIPSDYPIPKITHRMNKYKVFIPKAWGNMDEKAGLGGAYSDIIISIPNEICTESYVEQGEFSDIKYAKYQAKYILTRFARALFYNNKFSHNTPLNTWTDVPIQDFNESWWEESIDQIEERLFDKYNVPDHIRNFIRSNIQQKSEVNIINL